MSATSEHYGNGPTVVVVTAPWCTVCRAMEPSLVEVADRYRGRVRLARLDLAVEPEVASDLGVKGTPTIIGFVDGDEAFRVMGRRSLDELDELFAAIAQPGSTPPPYASRSDVLIRVGVGTILTVVGLAAGGVWPLVVVGLLTAGWGLAGLRGRRA